jgi:hypothetical protein
VDGEIEIGGDNKEEPVWCGFCKPYKTYPCLFQKVIEGLNHFKQRTKWAFTPPRITGTFALLVPVNHI